MGFQSVYALKGGYEEWVKAGFPAEKKGFLEQVCVTCHTKTTPGIVSDWKLSKHSQSEVTCSVCHGDLHNSAQDVPKAVTPTAETCQMCHETQPVQFKEGKHY